MELLTYTFSALAGGAVVFILAAIFLQDQVSRMTEALFDAVEYALATRQHRRAVAHRRTLALVPQVSTPAPDAPFWARHGRYAA